MRVPLVDLGAQHDEVADAVSAGWQAVLAQSSFVLGVEVAEFESAFAAFCEVAHCVGVANGTDAIELALRAIGVQPGDEVILPANSFVATAAAVARAGATPVFVDVDRATHLIDPSAVQSTVGPRTRAIVPVHLFGQMAPMAELSAIGEALNGVIVEDSAQAHGARQNGRSAGSIGLAAATSFYPGKNLGAYGDAGAVLTSDDAVARGVRLLRNHGGEAKYEHALLGFNSRMDTLQAVVLKIKLARLNEWNKRRQEAAARYNQLLGGLDAVELPSTAHGNEHVWHLYVVRVPKRDEVLRKLHDSGIGAGVHYPFPIHLLEGFSHLGHRAGDFPVAEAAAEEMLSLPIYPHISEAQQAAVAESLQEALR